MVTLKQHSPTKTMVIPLVSPSVNEMVIVTRIILFDLQAEFKQLSFTHT